MDHPHTKEVMFQYTCQFVSAKSLHHCINEASKHARFDSIGMNRMEWMGNYHPPKGPNGYEILQVFLISGHTDKKNLFW